METELKNVKIWKTDYEALIPLEMYNDVKSKHPNTEISIHFNCHFELDELRLNESVCWGDGKHFVFILKK